MASHRVGGNLEGGGGCWPTLAGTRARAGSSPLLTGIALCGVCGATVNAGGRNGPTGRKGLRIYRCTASYGHVSRFAEPVER